MASEIEEPKQGGRVTRLWKSVAACAKFCNALRNLKLVVLNDATDAPTAKLQVADGNAVLELHFLTSVGDEIPDPPDTGDYVLTAQDGVLSWEAIEDC